MKKYIITIIVLFAIILLSIGGYFIYSNAKTEDANSVSTLHKKCISELNYLGMEITKMANALNNISYTNFEIQNKEIEASSQSQSGSENSEGGGSSNSGEGTSSKNSIDTSVIQYDTILTQDDKAIDWNSIKAKIENMHSIWTTILIDLTTLNVNRDNLLKYNDLLDQIILQLEDEDKQAAVNTMADLYHLLTLYIEDFSEDSNAVSILRVKSNILYAYVSVEKGDWDTVKQNIEKAKQEFSNVMNAAVNSINQIDRINKAYVLLNELQSDSENQNNKIFYINYRNVMQELEAISL